MKTKSYIEDVLKKLDSYGNVKLGLGSNVTKIPTLEKNYYRPISPMLKVRFEMFSYLINATHGDWLSIEEMEKLWEQDIKDVRLKGIKEYISAHIESWDNNAGSIFQHNRLSIFAGSDYSYELIYLLWLDDLPEPQFWVYDTNGETRFKNLDEYLLAFINNDSYAGETTRWFNIGTEVD